MKKGEKSQRLTRRGTWSVSEIDCPVHYGQCNRLTILLTVVNVKDPVNC